LRARLFAAIDAACEHGARVQRNKDLGQVDLFASDDTPSASSIPLPDVAAWTEIEQLNFEKESLGLYWSGHPLDRFANDLREYGAKTTAELIPRKDEGEAASRLVDKERRSAVPGDAADVSIGGIVSGLRPLKTRKGDRMCAAMLDDASGSIDIVVFPEAFKQYGHLVENGQMLLVKGRFERDEESARILASEIAPLEVVRERLATSVAIRLTTPPHDRATFEKLWEVLAHHKGDRRVAFDIELKDTERRLRVTVDVNAQIRVRPSESLVSEVEKICGQGSVSLR
jgi:DNA polymerase-3 subunit alpha